MKRRLFFRSLVAAPVAAASTITTEKAKAEVIAVESYLKCSGCGDALLVHGDRDALRFVRCPKPQCSQFGKAYLAPEIRMEVVAADPKYVAEVDKARVEADRAWRAYEQQRKEDLEAEFQQQWEAANDIRSAVLHFKP